MNKPDKGLIINLILFLSLLSCQNSERSKDNPDNNILFDTITVAERYHLDENIANPHCDIAVELIYPMEGEDADIKRLQEFFLRSMFGSSSGEVSPEIAVKSYVENYVKNYIRDAEVYNLRDNDININMLNGLISPTDMSDSLHLNENQFYTYFENLSNRIVYNKRGVLSFQVKLSSNKGGASSHFVSYTNYAINLNSCQLLTENEIFKDGWDRALQNLIISSLLKNNRVKNLTALEDLGYFGVGEIVPNSNFLINDKGITYTFNKGEYSAYQLEAPEIFIPFEEIRSLIRESSIVSKLANL